jgi:hypothetical protein
MSYGKMNSFIDIVATGRSIDADGFLHRSDAILASVRAYKEDRHGSERWANRAAFTEASALFRFRRVPSLTITTEHVLVCADGRYRILSVEDVCNRGMYVEALADKINPSVR